MEAGDPSVTEYGDRDFRQIERYNDQHRHPMRDDRLPIKRPKSTNRDELNEDITRGVKEGAEVRRPVKPPGDPSVKDVAQYASNQQPLEEPPVLLQCGSQENQSRTNSGERDPVGDVTPPGSGVSSCAHREIQRPSSSPDRYGG